MRFGAVLLLMIVVGTLAGFLADGLRTGIGPFESLHYAAIYIMFEAALFIVFFVVYLIGKLICDGHPRNW